MELRHFSFCPIRLLFFLKNLSSLQTSITKNFINFNAQSGAGQGFAGLAFDAEPHAFAGIATRASWDGATTAVRRTYLDYFLTFLQSSHTLLNQNGQSVIPIHTTLAT
jgi:hypothetical protein